MGSMSEGYMQDTLRSNSGKQDIRTRMSESHHGEWQDDGQREIVKYWARRRSLSSPIKHSQTYGKSRGGRARIIHQLTCGPCSVIGNQVIRD